MKYVGLLFLLTAGIWAQSEKNLPTMMDSGNEFLSECDSRGHPEGLELVCIAYVSGITDGYVMARAKTGSDVDFCAPRNSTRKQAFDVFVKWLRDNPRDRDLMTAVLIRQAMIDAFPCPAKKAAK